MIRLKVKQVDALRMTVCGSELTLSWCACWILDSPLEQDGIAVVMLLLFGRVILRAGVALTLHVEGRDGNDANPRRRRILRPKSSQVASNQVQRSIKAESADAY